MQYTNQRGCRVIKGEYSAIHNNVERKSLQGACCEAKGIVERCTRSWQSAVVSGAMIAGGVVGEVEIAAIGSHDLESFSTPVGKTGYGSLTKVCARSIRQ
jgi:hypothetical protein